MKASELMARKGLLPAASVVVSVGKSEYALERCGRDVMASALTIEGGVPCMRMMSLPQLSRELGMGMALVLADPRVWALRG